MVYVSEDAAFTNILEPENTIPATVNSMYAPALDNLASTYADNQAGKAYYWHVRPCRVPKNCGPDPMSNRDLAQGSFTKRSPGVSGLASSDPAGGEITFTWDDYHDTNQAVVWAQTGERSPQAGKQYRIEVSVKGVVVDRQVVDQPTYTALDQLYPEGALEWRVQAIDAADNGLTWSATRQVVKRSPQVTLRSPVASGAVAGTTPFRWDPQAFSSSYDIEINRNEDTTFASRPRSSRPTASRPPPSPPSPRCPPARPPTCGGCGERRLRQPGPVVAARAVHGDGRRRRARLALTRRDGVPQRSGGAVAAGAGATTYDVVVTPLRPARP